jgi:hypothetical protein
MRLILAKVELNWNLVNIVQMLRHNCNWWTLEALRKEVLIVHDDLGQPELW